MSKTKVSSIDIRTKIFQLSCIKDIKMAESAISIFVNEIKKDVIENTSATLPTLGTFFPSYAQPRKKILVEGNKEKTTDLSVIIEFIPSSNLIDKLYTKK